jgi:NNP family nitrate/nitrite transporter-like MFS transporter
VEQSGQKSIYQILTPILFLAGILFFTFLSRVVFSPLLVQIEEELHLSHAKSGSLFLLISIGFAPVMLCSGFVSQRLTHRGTILLSSVTCGVAVLIIAFSRSLFTIQLGMIVLGMGSGLYFPSAMATMTRLVDPEHWGKAISLHEAGPTMGYVLAPIVAELGLAFTSWRGVLVIVGAGGLIMAATFAVFGQGGRFTGEPPRLDNVGRIFYQPSFWVIAVLMSLACGASVGVYAILPVYLISEQGLDQGLVNTVVGLSRISGLVAVFLAGWLADRFGAKRVMGAVYTATAVLTGLMGVGQKIILVTVVFLQPAVVSAFFPVALLGLANVGPPKTRNVAVSLMIPFVYLFGGGVVPAGMGVVGEYYGFALGFLLMGGLLLTSLCLLLFLQDRPNPVPETSR